MFSSNQGLGILIDPLVPFIKFQVLFCDNPEQVLRLELHHSQIIFVLNLQ